MRPRDERFSAKISSEFVENIKILHNRHPSSPLPEPPSFLRVLPMRAHLVFQNGKCVLELRVRGSFTGSPIGTPSFMNVMALPTVSNVFFDLWSMPY